MFTCAKVADFSFVSFTVLLFLSFCKLRDKQLIVRGDSMYFRTWLVPEFLCSIVHLKCLLSLVLVL